MKRIRSVTLIFGFLSLVQAVGNAQQIEPAEYSHWPEDLKINGRVIVNHGSNDVSGLQRVVQRIANGKSVVCLNDGQETGYESWRAALENAVGENGNFTVISSEKVPNDLLASVIASADCVFLEAFPSDLHSLTELQGPLHALVKRGGTLIADAEVARRFGKHYIVNKDTTAAGLNLLPECLLDVSLDAEELIRVLDKHPRTVGLRLEDGGAFMLSGRKLMALGSGRTTVALAAGTADQSASVTLVANRGRQRGGSNSMIDLTQWRRMAIDRDLPPFPGETPPKPVVENGTLIIIGGGGSPPGTMTRFIELAGGVDEARLVYVPCSESETVAQRQGTVESWRRMGVQHATHIHTKDRNQANTDDEFLAPLKEATGIFFGGGRQWNFSDSYYGTKAHALMKDVLKRGGVIAGSSAGASIQGRYLARATPIGNFRIMAPGYERGGLGFLAGVAIDQHFTQRGRQKDMTQLIEVYPQLLGIGLDEGTAIEVQKSIATVRGRGRVFFYDAKAQRADGDPNYIALPEGSSFELAKRVVLEDTRKTSEESAESPKEADTSGNR